MGIREISGLGLGRIVIYCLRRLHFSMKKLALVGEDGGAIGIGLEPKNRHFGISIVTPFSAWTGAYNC